MKPTQYANSKTISSDYSTVTFYFEIQQLAGLDSSCTHLKKKHTHLDIVISSVLERRPSPLGIFQFP